MGDNGLYVREELVGVLGELIPVLEEHGEIEVDTRTKQKLLKISASTIDRPSSRA